MTIQINDPTRLSAMSISEVVTTQQVHRLDFYSSFGKRALDIAFVLLTLPVTLPMMILAALLISLDGGSPIYVQRRVGRGGRIFKMFKFRSMVPDAERALREHLEANPEALAEWTYSQKLRNDPRVTRLGSIMRKCSLDELPQLLNVLLGDMSLIGPRPMMVDQTNMYPGRAYYWMRPGISGLWQVTDRNDTAFTARAQYDDKYFYKLSFANDCSILAKTFVVVFRGTGY
ncbi:sugar transferase [Sedimentitalea nanhaiensis]|uniref:Sugar transferase involved in LPS biosynthesis (Colanic, teichoic acid) n=1 Tax=Sedimentitalea nanhaiensis TaxID=999627 RepID=A0A1I7D827_9RHOB|nr:sugar transferase [Sedimentitalea nanhaiensis]SFU07755.1 Sugar transferase involved in LPS biosynthesis (colanic, teichoic acid) [Sedimentitalea nanhaiensis]